MSVLTKRPHPQSQAPAHSSTRHPRCTRMPPREKHLPAAQHDQEGTKSPQPTYDEYDHWHRHREKWHTSSICLSVMDASFGMYFLATSMYISVLMPPGAIALTVMPLRPKSVLTLATIHVRMRNERGGLTNSKTSSKRLYGPLTS